MAHAGQAHLIPAYLEAGADINYMVLHPRVDARQSQKSISQIYRGMDLKRQFRQPRT